VATQPLSPPTSSTVVIGELLADRYRLDEVIGVGGMSTVYRGFDCELERDVAVKVLHAGMILDSGSVSRFQREAVTGAALSHEHIVSVLDRGADRGRPFIVLEYAGRTNLKQLLGESGPLPLEQALELTIQVARGLAFAHTQGCIHRDVKPHNVLLEGHTAKLADFGIARWPSTTDRSTFTGTVVGSADYISPEQAQGGAVDERSDVYSLGVMLYELLTGRLPFTRDSFVAVATQHVTTAPPPPRRFRPLPSRVDHAVRRALAKDPNKRFQTMNAFAAELESCLARAHGHDTAETVRIRTPVTRPQNRAAGLAAFWAVALLAVLAALGGMFLPHGAKKKAVTTAQTTTVATRHTAAAAPKPVPVPVKAVAAYDPPPGDGAEYDSVLSLATDGDASTAWSTETYATAAFGNLKDGVGIVVDAGKIATVDALTVHSDTPGFRAEVRVGPAADGPFRAVSQTETVGAATTFTLAHDTRARYFLLWITALPPSSGPKFHADVNEVTARGPGDRSH
jgi:eukaryotic-like serine/threonine-protein kinase